MRTRKRKVMRSRTMTTIKMTKHSNSNIEVHRVNVSYFSIDIYLILLHHICMSKVNLVLWWSSLTLSFFYCKCCEDYHTIVTVATTRKLWQWILTKSDKVDAEFLESNSPASEIQNVEWEILQEVAFFMIAITIFDSHVNNVTEKMRFSYFTLL